ncbi:MAG: hypothetical protein U0235_31990 [Polyangiaceae bacterium]
MKLVCLSSIAIVSSLLVACGGSAVDAPATAAATDGGAPTAEVHSDAQPPSDAAASVDAAAPSGACNALDPSATPVATMALVADEAPVPAGGTIEDGSYELASITVYTGKGGAAGPLAADVRWRLHVEAGVAEQAFVCGAGCDTPGAPRHARATLSVTGTTLRSVESCPTARIRQQSFTATKDAIVFYERNDTSQIVTYVFAKAH